MTDGTVDTMLAMVFPGQGSQSVGMLAELAAQHPQVEQTFAQASAVLGYDLWATVQAGPAERLAQTEITQPALLAAGVATYRAWRAGGGAAPAVMAGHSLGEYAALVCAGVLDLQAAIVLVRARGGYMQQAVAPGVGAMAAVIGLERAAVVELCEAAAEQQVVTLANHNAPLQSVIAGHIEAVGRAAELARARGAKRVVMLAVSAPFHCPLMQPAALRLAADLAAVSFEVPQVTVINNVDVAAEIEPARIRAALERQVCAPVRWVELVQAMAARGVTHVLECGPGGVLAGLGKRIVPAQRWQALDDVAAMDSARALLAGAATPVEH